MYDLAPVRLSKRSEYVKFTDEIESELSAMRHLDKLNTPLVLTYGTYETPEFQRQSREFAAAVKAAGKPLSSFWSAKAITISKCWKRSPTRTVCSAARC